MDLFNETNNINLFNENNTINLINEDNTMDLFLFNEDIISEISQHLTIHDIHNCIMTCKHFYATFTSNLVWYPIYNKANDSIMQSIPIHTPLFYIHLYEEYANKTKNINKIKTTLDFLNGSANEIFVLHDLQYKYYKLIYIPKEIGLLTNLQRLCLSYNNITKIPEEINQLSKLKILKLSHNHIKEIPKTLCQLSNLQCIFLQCNQILAIPKEIGQLSNLQYLYLHYNKISTIPEEINQLTNLKHLWVQNHNIISIPQNISHMLPIIRTFLFFPGNGPMQSSKLSS